MTTPSRQPDPVELDLTTPESGEGGPSVRADVGITRTPLDRVAWLAETPRSADQTRAAGLGVGIVAFACAAVVAAAGITYVIAMLVGKG